MRAPKEAGFTVQQANQPPRSHNFTYRWSYSYAPEAARQRARQMIALQ